MPCHSQDEIASTFTTNGYFQQVSNCMLFTNETIHTSRCSFFYKVAYFFVGIIIFVVARENISSREENI